MLEKTWLTDSGTYSELFNAIRLSEFWDRKYAKALVEEYRRFLYLAEISKGDAVASQDIITAVTLHREHLPDDWEELRQKLGPENHAAYDQVESGRESATLERYRHTLNLYRQEFNADPPTDVWPRAERILARPRGRLILFLGVLASLAGLIVLSSPLSRNPLALLLLLPGPVLVLLGFWMSGMMHFKLRHKGF